MMDSRIDGEELRCFLAWRRRPHQTGSTAPDAPTAQSIYIELMKTRFAPWLRGSGLRGSDGRFELPSESHWAQLGFQKSAYSDRTEIRFTINLLAISRAEWESQRAAKPYLGTKPKPGTLYGDWAQQTRIGALIPTGEDKWWHLYPGQDLDEVTTDVIGNLGDYGIPWLKAAITT